MTQEQLKRGKELEEEIKTVKDHKEDIKSRYNDTQVSFSVVSPRTSRLQMVDVFMPMNAKEYLELYIFKCDCYIRKCEQELKNL